MDNDQDKRPERARGAMTPACAGWTSVFDKAPGIDPARHSVAPPEVPPARPEVQPADAPRAPASITGPGRSGR